MPVAIVTGASRGIGRVIALQLAKDGMDVAINDIPSQLPALENVKIEIELLQRRAICVPADVSKEDEVRQMVALTVREFGELNVMVANAGIVIPQRLFETTVEDWDKVMGVNARGVFMCYREAGRQMIAQGKGGKIIGACSSAGYRPSPLGVAYSASKWAVRGITQVTALELAQYDINVNAYCPGPVDTNMWAEIDASISRRDGQPRGQSYEQSIQSRCALKRPQTPEDIAALVSFLASPKSRNITGQSILTDGGMYFS